MLKKTVIFLFVFMVYLNAGIINTKHNLSTSGPGTIKGTSEQEICAFCHIPHGAQPGKPLWNRAMPTSSYTMYSSTYLERTSYPTPTNLGTSVDTPGNLSRQCLSCHDGTIAIGAIYILRGTVLGSALSVADTNADGTMKNTAGGFIGTDLSAHHPVGFEYGASMDLSFGADHVTTRGNELRATPTSPVKTYNYSGKEYVECSSCHDPHTENKKFLRVGADNSDSHALNIKNTCTSCHNKDGFTGSIHDTSSKVYTDSTALTDYGAGTTVGDMGCVNCHTPHNGEGQPYLLRKIEQNTCFQGPAGSNATASCHQSSGSPGKDIESQLSKSYGHGYTLLNTDGVHTNLDYRYGNGVVRDPIGSKGINWGDSQHVECMDCHNQHQAKVNTRVASGSWYPTATDANSNKISNSGPLTGASGVRPKTWPSEWTKATAYTTLETATYEYEICFKCHSSWSLDNTTDPESTYTMYSDVNYKFTDTAWEFNVNNSSGHPVVIGANSRTTGQGALTNNHMKGTAPWNTNRGTQTMMCSDCHGANDETTKSKGPHGSTANYMLKGVNTSWPGQNLTASLYTTLGRSYSDSNAGLNNLFCKNCHTINSGDTTAPHSEKNEMANISCLRCHSKIPHGTPNKRLIIFRTDPAPYQYQNQSYLLNYTGGFGSGSITAICDNCGGNSCSDKHSTANYP